MMSFSDNMAKSGSSILAFVEAEICSDDVPKTIFILIPGSFHFQEVEAKSVAPFLSDILKMNLAILNVVTNDTSNVMGLLTKLSYRNPEKFTSDKPINITDVIISESLDFMLSKDAKKADEAEDELDRVE